MNGIRVAMPTNHQDRVTTVSERDLKMGERMAIELIPLIGDCVRQADDRGR